MKIGIMRALNECVGRIYKAASKHKQNNSNIQGIFLLINQKIIKYYIRMGYNMDII